MYPYPGWRRVFFAGVLVAVLVIALAPSITQGTLRVHIYGLNPPGIIDHLYIKFSSMQLHTYGFASTTGWVSVNYTAPPIDLVHVSTLFLPQTAANAQVTSGRYDAIRLILTNSTAILGTRPIPLANTPTLNANFTLPIPPNGFGDVLLLISFDGSLVLATPPVLSIQIVQTAVV